MWMRATQPLIPVVPWIVLRIHPKWIQLSSHSATAITSSSVPGGELTRVSIRKAQGDQSMFRHQSELSLVPAVVALLDLRLHRRSKGLFDDVPGADARLGYR